LFGYGDTEDGQMEFFATAINPSRFAEWLSSPDAAGRKVIDKTGVSGLYDFYVKHADPRISRKSAETGSPAPELSGAPLIKAIEEQLGLKLEPAKTTFEFIVIDSASKPSEN
jgi:uncharacterized protein (TIGR03435 family)